MLEPNDLCEMKKGYTVKWKVDNNDLEVYRLWPKDEVSFSKVPLSVVFDFLDIWFDHTLKLTTVSDSNVPFTGELNRRAGKQAVLMQLQTATGVQIAVKDSANINHIK